MSSFSPHHRIKNSADFRRAYNRRRTASDAVILLFAYPNSLAFPRLGVSASRKLGGAVVRNRWKRLIREAFRLTMQELPRGVDLVVIPRANARPTLESLVESLPKLAARASRPSAR